MLLGESGVQHLPIAFSGCTAEFEILAALLGGVGVLLALAVAVLPDRPQVEHLLQIELAVGGPADAIARVAHRLHIEAHAHPVGAGLLHHRVGEPAHVQHDLGMLERAVVAALAGQQTLDADLTGLRLIGPVGAVGHHESFAVVLVHRRVDALLRIRGGGDQLDPEAVHGNPATGQPACGSTQARRLPGL